MSTQVTVTVPDEIYEHAQYLAQQTSSDVAGILADMIEWSMPILHPPQAPVIELSDEEVLALAELQMQPDQDHRLSELLHQQQAGTLSVKDRPELVMLLQACQEDTLRKAQAMQEAVRRGLRTFEQV